MRSQFFILTFTLILIIDSSITSHAAAADYLVIANASDPITNHSENIAPRIKQLYLKESKTWRSSLLAKPFARSPGSQVQRAFEENILQMSASQLDTHWLRLKQIRGETPPRAIGSTQILLRQLQRKPGAFATIKRSEYIPDENTVIILEFSSD